MVETTVDTESRVADQTEEAFGVGLAGRRGTEKSRRGCDQFRQDQEIAVVGADVQSVDGQHVGAGLQRAEEFAQIDLFCDRRLFDGPSGRGGGVPLRRVGRMATGDLPAVDVGHQSVIVLHS